MRMTWEMPRIMVQEFEANEYVAACWTVGCSVGSGNYGGYGKEASWAQWNGGGTLWRGVRQS